MQMTSSPYYINPEGQLMYESTYTRDRLIDGVRTTLNSDNFNEVDNFLDNFGGDVDVILFLKPCKIHKKK